MKHLILFDFYNFDLGKLTLRELGKMLNQDKIKPKPRQ